MSKNDKDNKNFAFLTKAQLLSLIDKIKEITEALEDIEDIIKSETKKPSVPTDNISYIYPGLIYEYNLIKGKSVSLIGIVDNLIKWSEEVYKIVVFNKGKFTSNKSLRNHINNLSFVLTELKTVVVDKLQESSKK